MSKLFWIRMTMQLLSVLAFGIVTIEAKLPTMHSLSHPSTDGSCCVTRAHNPPSCPTGSGMSGSSCCNLQVCLQLFLQTGELHFGSNYADFQWNGFDAHEFTRTDRPPVPPPRT